jgi:hypothetical protein
MSIPNLGRVMIARYPTQPGPIPCLCLTDEDNLGREYGTWEKDGTEFGEHNIVYLATLQEIRMGYARFGVRINQIKSNQSLLNHRIAGLGCYASQTG